MYLVLKEPIKVIRAIGTGGRKKETGGYKSVPGMKMSSSDSVRDKVSPDFSFAEHHPKKIQYGEKDIEV
jgi:hypothetical protein